ncbi:monofunctional biosynthetic peptidoglycan transglycosylase [Bdellovibrio sp. HCB337]|uniref:monofunctional biosynthetic peptidoglycan transglycosylase n=1 Tax=Bdellovibrio sp. HCB337 TaxID=3394358 RepID=UPI0039A5361A
MKRPWKHLILRTLLLCFMSSLGIVLLYSFMPVFVTPLMVIRSVSSLWGPQLVGVHKTWVPLEEISPNMKRAVLKAEDYRFYEHSGFDFEAIEKAIQYNKTHKRKKGASTISQQTAKNVFLWPNRDWVRKGFEAYFTVLIELVWSKDRIMEVYLNVIEFGPGVYGVEAASQKYFRRSAKNLNPSQAAMMAAVLPNPYRLRIDRPSSYVLGRQRRILYRASPAVPKVEEASLWDSLKFDSSDEE